MPAEKDELSEELQAALKSLIDTFELEDLSVRQRQIRLWKKLTFYWCGITEIWWSETAHDWRVNPDYQNGDMNDKRINIFRPYLESIIAALSSTVPGIICAPDDAENSLDILTAKGGTKISELVYQHNNAPLLWAKSLFTYCIQGMIASYTYSVEDEKYGTVEVPKYEETEEEVDQQVCPNCQAVMNPQEFDAAEKLSDDERDEYDPGPDDVEVQDLLWDHRAICPQCLLSVDPETQRNKVVIKRLAGVTNQPKSRQMIEVAGGLFVKIPNYARNQSEMPYLAYNYELHYTQVYQKYPFLRDKTETDQVKLTSSSGNDMYERWGRLSPQYFGEYPLNTPTVRNWWLRPSAFEGISDEETRKELFEKFPNGCKCVWINEIFACAENESLDDHWTISFNPLSEYVHFDPLGQMLTSIQEISNDLLALTLQTIEQGIPQSFADPAVLDFETYRNAEVKPGSIYPAKNKGGKSIAEGFHTITTATLSPEVMPFGNQIQESAQFVTGALPSLFGGAQPGSSRTAAQYSMSRNQAMQRLQTPWKMVNVWWKQTFEKVIPAYMKNMLEDERLVKEVSGSFVNEVIKKSQMDGKMGSITTTSADEIPHTWGAIKDTIMELMQTNNPMIMGSLTDPSNIGVMTDAIGLTDFHIPGADDRVKQFDEIQLLIQSTPIPGPPDPMTGQAENMPSIMPELEVDNHQVQATVTRDWLVSEAGRQCKIENPPGYDNVLAHLKMHLQMMQQLSAGMAPPPEEAPAQKLKPIAPPEGNP